MGGTEKESWGRGDKAPDPSSDLQWDGVGQEGRGAPGEEQWAPCGAWAEWASEGRGLRLRSPHGGFIGKFKFKTG